MSKQEASPAPVSLEKPVVIYKGRTNAVSRSGTSRDADPLETVRKDLADAMNSKNLSFLFGSGCSSARVEGKEVGIPTMGPMAASFLAGDAVPEEVREQLKSVLGIDITTASFAGNLERLMEVLYGYRFALEQSIRPELAEMLPVVNDVIDKVKRHVLEICLAGQTADAEGTVLSTYERFYRRLAQRDRALPRPWIFTTNYDLFNETAMDRLGMPYINGFQGSIDRRFNPASFRYTIAEQLDISSRKWSSIDSLVYFAKLHGSLSWRSTDAGLFPVKESMPRADEENVGQLLIYPTPAKQNASFASPYSDMFRELQSRVAREQSALITVGYSFGDEHVNNIIFQALTIPTFRLVAFVDPGLNDTVRRLRELDDPRIWIVGTEERTSAWKAHYFANFVEEFMPSAGEDPTDSAIERLVAEFIHRDPEATSDEQ